jgi:hypothetical protein
LMKQLFEFFLSFSIYLHFETFLLLFYILLSKDLHFKNYFYITLSFYGHQGELGG